MSARPKRREARADARAIGAALVLSGAVALLSAQYRINTQLNTELYGHGVGTVRYGMRAMPNRPMYQATLPSEWRNQAFLSGSLRSDIRGQYLRTGPLAPSGSLAYIPSPMGNRPYGGTQPYGYSRAPMPYQARTIAPQSRPPIGPTSLGGSIRYGGGSTLRTPITGGVSPLTMQPTLGPKPPLVSMGGGGSIRYGR